jgi:hypothetical protein
MGFENSGRRPQPTAITVLRGNPSKKKLNENEPCPPAGDVAKPAGLSSIAGVVWDELAPICLVMGTLTVADVRPFARLCELQADLDLACAMKDAPEFGLFTAGLHAAVKLEKDLSPVIRPYYALFGLEPVSRARIAVPKKPDEPASKWAGILK